MSALIGSKIFTRRFDIAGGILTQLHHGAPTETGFARKWTLFKKNSNALPYNAQLLEYSEIKRSRRTFTVRCFENALHHDNITYLRRSAKNSVFDFDSVTFPPSAVANLERN